MKPHTTSIFTEKTLDRLRRVTGNRSGFVERAITLVHGDPELRKAVVERVEKATDGGPRRHVSVTISREAIEMAEKMADRVPASRSAMVEHIVKEVLVNRRAKSRILKDLLLAVPTTPQ